jgi:UDP-N-acetylglucosamine--N-acetylmuramyl-(pentapeptide) pyrophosphoryl-undecaprenol N-acetylglucosamine transferase
MGPGTSRADSVAAWQEGLLKVVIAGGGTGGHVFIGVAIARELLSRDAGHEVLFVGTRKGLESTLVPREGFELVFIESAGLKGTSPVTLVRNALLIPGGMLSSRRLLSAFRPDAAVGVGGYSSGPALLAAWTLGVPSMIVEPNAWPGLANRWLAPFVKLAAVALPEAAKCLGRKSVVTGIPVRSEFAAIPPVAPRAGHLTLLVYGGSQGSSSLNKIVCDGLRDLRPLLPVLRIIHQTGPRELDAVRTAYAAANVDAEVRDFLPRIYEKFALADVVLSRAGAGTVAELAAAGRGAILVPFPRAADDHQTRNARALERVGAAKVIPESEWAPGRLAGELGRLMESPDELRRMGEAARKAARPDATARIVDLVYKIARR